MRRLLLWPCLALCAPPILAGAQPAARPQAGLAWDFSLPALDGVRFVRLSDQQGPVLVNFWSRDCPPCVTELPRLQAFADAHPTWTVLLVSTDTPTAATEFVRAHAITLPVLRPGGNVAALMRSAGNRVGALPLTGANPGGPGCGARPAPAGPRGRRPKRRPERARSRSAARGYASRVTRRISSGEVSPLSTQRAPSSRMLSMPAALAARRSSRSSLPSWIKRRASSSTVNNSWMPERPA